MRSPSSAQNKGDWGNWAPEQLGNGPHGEVVLFTTWPQIKFINLNFKPRGAQCAQIMELEHLPFLDNLANSFSEEDCMK